MNVTLGFIWAESNFEEREVSRMYKMKILVYTWIRIRTPDYETDVLSTRLTVSFWRQCYTCNVPVHFANLGLMLNSHVISK